MKKRTLLTAAMASVFLHGAHGAQQRLATITGGGGLTEHCRIEVDVDDSAELEIIGDRGELRTLSGQQSLWREFRCTAALPWNPFDVRIQTVRSRGRVHLQRIPSGHRSSALIRIDDPGRGRGVHAFMLQWRAAGGVSPFPPAQDPGQGWYPGERVMLACREAVTGRLNEQGFPYVTFGNVTPEMGPGPTEKVSGNVTARRRFGSTSFAFSCWVESKSGRVRNLDLRVQ